MLREVLDSPREIGYTLSLTMMKDTDEKIWALAPGDVIFLATIHPVGMLVKAWQWMVSRGESRKWWIRDHVVIVALDTSRVVSAEPRGGVRYRDTRELVRSANVGAYVYHSRIPIVEAAERAESAVGRRYDFVGVASFVMEKLLGGYVQVPGMWYCSELAAWSHGAPPGHYSPAALAAYFGRVPRYILTKFSCLRDLTIREVGEDILVYERGPAGFRAFPGYQNQRGDDNA